MALKWDLSKGELWCPSPALAKLQPQHLPGSSSYCLGQPETTKQGKHQASLGGELLGKGLGGC